MLGSGVRGTWELVPTNRPRCCMNWTMLGFGVALATVVVVLILKMRGGG